MHRAPLRARLAPLLLSPALIALSCLPAAAARARARAPTRARPHETRLLILDADGRTSERTVPLAGGALAPQPISPGTSGEHVVLAPRARASSDTSVTSALARLARGGSLSAHLEAQYSSEYQAAQSSLRHLSGTRYAELGAVLENIRTIAEQGGFTPSRLPVLFLTLARNRQWWTTGPLLASGERIGFPGSRLVWEYYPGQGIEIQWLGTFGEANGYYLSGREDGALRALLDEALPLASQRAGGIAWEYLFHFDGGSPPWTSALSQGTAIQVLSRAYQRLHDTTYLKAAEAALGIFRHAPPEGVRVAKRNAAWYVQYTFAPDDLILNGFIQSLVGLYEFTDITGDALGQRLFEAGDAMARSRVPRYDTGSWSRYDQFSESDLSYHDLLTEFLEHLCERTQHGEPLARFKAAAERAASGSKGAGTGGAGTTGSSGATGASGASGASGAAGGSSAPPGVSPVAEPGPIAGDAVYCSTAKRFRADVHTPPKLSLISHQLPTGAHAGVQIALSKVATVSLTVRRGKSVVWTDSATVEGGRPRLLWITPTRPGSYTVTLSAVDLAGNHATATGTIVLRSPAPPRSRRAARRAPARP